MKSESVLVSRAAHNWRPPVRRSRRHRPPPFGLPCRTRPFLRGPLLPGQPRFPFPAVACFPAPKGLRLAELGTCGERPPGEACGTLGRGPCSRPFPVCVRSEYFNRKNMARKIFSKENDGAQKNPAGKAGSVTTAQEGRLYWCSPMVQRRCQSDSMRPIRERLLLHSWIVRNAWSSLS